MSNGEVWYGHDRKIYDMKVLERIFKKICDEYLVYPYSGYVRVGTRRWFTYGIQVSIKGKHFLIYFIKEYEESSAIFFDVRSEKPEEKIKNQIFFNGSELEKLSFEILPENCFFILRENEKGKLRLTSKQSDYLEFFEKTLQKYGLMKPVETSEVPG